MLELLEQLKLDQQKPDKGFVRKAQFADTPETVLASEQQLRNVVRFLHWRVLFLGVGNRSRNIEEHLLKKFIVASHVKIEISKDIFKDNAAGVLS